MEGKEPGERVKKKVIKKIFHNWSLKLASLILAAILWFLIVQIEDPKDTRTFNNIPVKLTNTELLDKENKVYEVLDNTDIVNVTVRAPRSVFEELRASDIVAEADVSKLTDINTIAITYPVQNVGTVDSIEGNHDVVRLNVENKKTRWIKMTYDTIGEVAENYMIAGASLDQTQIEISGPESVINSVDHAGVEIDVTGVSTNQTANAEVVLYDKDGASIQNNNIKKNVNYMRISVEVLAVKEVPVEVNYMGIPADGYMATGVAVCDPASVKLAGTAYALSDVTKISIPAERLNITGETDNMTETINLREYLPDNVKWADSGFNGRVTTTVYIEPIAEKKLEVPIANVMISNQPEGLKIQLPEDMDSYTLNVSGLGEFIEPLRQTDIRGIIDLAAWMEKENITELAPGNYLVPVTFGLAEEITAEEVLVRITVSAVEE